MTRPLLYLGAIVLLAPSLALAQSSAERLAQARAAREAGSHPEAIRLYRTLVEDPDLAVRALALESAALLLSWQGEYDDAVKYYREVARISPQKRRDAIYGTARTLGWARRHAEALHELKPLIAADPDDVDIRMLEGQIAGWGGFTDRSVDALERVLALKTEHREVQLTLAKVLAWGGRLAESERQFAELLEKYPGYGDAMVGMAYTLMWQGRASTARTYFDRITDAEFTASRQYRITRSALHWGLGERAGALHERKQLMREFPGEPDVRDLWRAQSGVVGHNLRGDAQILRDNQGLEIRSLGAGGAYDMSNPVFVFAEGRKEWLGQDDRSGGLPRDDVEVLGGRGGLDFNYEKLSVRGSLGARHSDVDTGGTTGGLAASFTIRPNIGVNLGADTDFAFFTPQAVRNEVRMTGLNLTTWSQVSSRLGLNFTYMRTHFEGQRVDVDQNRDWLAGAARFQGGGFGLSQGNVRIDLGLRGLYFRFDRQFPDVGYWNPRRFRQVLASVTPTYRRGEEFTLIAHAAAGVQSQNDGNWEPALYFHGEFLRQLGRRWDAWSRADYSTTDIRRRTDDDGYRAWSLAGGFMVRLGERQPEPKRAREPKAPLLPATITPAAAAAKRIDYEPAPVWPSGLRERIAVMKAERRPTILVLGESKIVVPHGAVIGVQVDRVIRDIHWTPSAFDASVPADRAPRDPADVVPYMEGRLAADLMRFAGVTLLPLTPAVVKLDPARPEYGYAADAEANYRFLIDSSKIAYASARAIGPAVVLLPDTHGFASVAAEGARLKPHLVMACMDMPSKAAGALYLAERGIHAYGPTDRFGYELLGYRLRRPDAGTIIGSAPIRRGPDGGAVIGGQPVEIALDETIVVQWTDRQTYPWQYNDSAWRYFAALDDLYGLGLDLVKVSADAGQLEKVIEVARSRGVNVVAVRVGKANTEDETRHDAEVLSRWLEESPRRRAVLLHSAAYEAGYKLYFDFPKQTTFGDLDPRLR